VERVESKQVGSPRGEAAPAGQGLLGAGLGLLGLGLGLLGLGLGLLAGGVLLMPVLPEPPPGSPGGGATGFTQGNFLHLMKLPLEKHISFTGFLVLHFHPHWHSLHFSTVGTHQSPPIMSSPLSSDVSPSSPAGRGV
jgi:hypothetical protein